MARKSLKGVIQVCAAKRRFPSLEEAKTFAGPGLNCYRCLACNGYHLTSQGAITSAKKKPSDERKPTFEPSILGRVKVVKATNDENVKVVVPAIVATKPKVNGNLKVRISGEEYETTVPFQPAHLRNTLVPGKKVKVEFQKKPLHVKVLP